MEVKASLHNLRVAPRKMRQVVDVVRNKDVVKAKYLLEYTVKRGAQPVLKLLNSAIASATNTFKLDENNLYIAKITVDEGPKLKRWHPMSRGRAYPILKRTSHIALVLATKGEAPTKKGKKKAAVSPIVEEKKSKAPARKPKVKTKKA